MLIQGIFPAITTPFYPDGKLYLKKLEHNVDRYSRTPISGMVVLGSTGEAVMLSEEEQREVLRITIEVAADSKVLIAGVGQESAELTLAMTDYAAKLGYDVALVRTPSYYRPQMKNKPESMLAYYRYVADRSAIPVMLYSVPPFTAYDLPTEFVIELAQHPNIIGIKESSGNVEKITEIKLKTASVKRTVNVTEIFNAVTRRMEKGIPANSAAPGGVVSVEALKATSTATAVAAPPAPPATKPKLTFKTRTKGVSFQIAAGAAQKLLPSLQAGAGAAVLAFGSPAPTACYEVYTAWKDGDESLAKLKQERLGAVAQRVGSELGVPGIKYAMDLNGYYGGPARLPLLPLTGAEKQEIEKLMADLRN
jgi:4-hydroxy-2-oxoglutarate aldolase